MLSLYIHIPYCVRKCHYCGFYSTAYSKEHAEEFLTAFAREAGRWQELLTDKLFGSVYIGGGTPTALSIKQLEYVFTVIRNSFQIDEHAEFTMEANPHTVTSSCLAFLRDNGVNRLSLGIQSFSDTILRTLGRLHSAQQAREAFHLARNAGFKNIGIDLIFGIPGQSEAAWEQTIDTATTLRPEHVSAYSLSLDEGSQFARLVKAKTLALPDDEIVATMYELMVEKLRWAGYQRYEISNFSLQGRECRHNRNYWARGEYLGLGPGAASFLAGTRFENIPDTVEYIRRLKNGLRATEMEETVGTESGARETMLLGLRTVQGVDMRCFKRAFGACLTLGFEDNIRALAAAGLLQMDEGRLRLSDQGFLLSDEVLARLSV